MTYPPPGGSPERGQTPRPSEPPVDPTRAFPSEAAPGQPDQIGHYGQPGLTGGFGQPYGAPDAPTQPTFGAPNAYAPPAPGGPDAYTPPAPGAADAFTQPAFGTHDAPTQPTFGAPDAYAPPAYSQPPGGGYGAGGGQAYGQPPYGGPPAYGAPTYATAKPTNTLAILSLVFAFVFPIAGVVMGHVAKRQIRDSGEEGSGLATAGLAVGYAFTAIGLLLCVGYGVLIAVAVNSSDGGTVSF